MYIKKILDQQNNLKPKHLVYGSLIVLILFFSAISIFSLSPFRSNTGGLQYFRAKVVSVDNVTSAVFGQEQIIRAKILDGGNSGQIFTVTRNIVIDQTSTERMPVGSEILLTKNLHNGNQYLYLDRWRMPGVALLLLIFLILVILVGWWRGITSVFGLVISIGVLATFVVPRIVNGHSPYATCIEAAFIITVISIFVAHGISRRTTIAFSSSIITLLLVIGVLGFSTYITGTSGTVDENTVNLISSTHTVDIDGLLTGGIIIASLGVLYDITTGQAAAVDEIYKAHTKQSSRQLYRSGLSVGREHIAALVNTLALVYVGVALPTIVITAIYNNAPLLVVFNNETIVEEVVKTCVASIGMLLAVPITTFLAAYLLPKWYAVRPPTKT